MASHGTESAGDTRDSEFATTASGGGTGGSGGGGTGGNGGSGGTRDDGSGGRFPWVCFAVSLCFIGMNYQTDIVRVRNEFMAASYLQVPVVFFLLAAATYPILRDATETRKESKQVQDRNPITILLVAMSSFGDKLWQTLHGSDRDSAALRAAQQDAYASKVAEQDYERISSSGSKGGFLSGAGSGLPARWGGSVEHAEDGKEDTKVSRLCKNFKHRRHCRVSPQVQNVI